MRSQFGPGLAEAQMVHTELSHLKVRILTHSCEEFLLKDVTLTSFLREYSPCFGIYAVILTHGSMSRHYSGIFLQEVVVPGGYSAPGVQRSLPKLKGGRATRWERRSFLQWLLW